MSRRIVTSMYLISDFSFLLSYTSSASPWLSTGGLVKVVVLTNNPSCVAHESLTMGEEVLIHLLRDVPEVALNP